MSDRIDEFLTRLGARDNLDQVAKEIKACQRCELRQNTTRPVPGFGSVGAKYFLIGEAPGASEDKTGVPFVGAAGRRLDKLLALASIDINDCYLSNVCRCQPPSNRDPRKKEIRTCVGFLWREIMLVKPQYLVTLGSVPLSLFCPYGIRQMHGCMFEFDLDEEKPLVIPSDSKTKKRGEPKEAYAHILSGLFISSD